MRQGTVFKRCTQCGARIDAKARRCGKCGGDRHTWAFVVDLAPPGAPRKQRKQGGFATKREALVAMAEVQAAAVTGGYVAPTRQTVGHYLALWLPTAKARLRASAYDACELHVRTYIVPRIGDLPLHALTPTRARALYAELAESGGVRQRCQRCKAPAGTARRDGDGRSVCQADANGRPCGGSEFNAGGLSAKSVHNIHRTLSRALSDAVNDGLLPRNPVERCHTMPESPEQQTWSAHEVRRFLAHVATDRLVAMWRVAATTGIRRGELVGLRWRDVDLEAGRITIAQQRAKGAGVVAAGPTKTRQIAAPRLPGRHDRRGAAGPPQRAGRGAAALRRRLGRLRARLLPSRRIADPPRPRDPGVPNAQRRRRPAVDQGARPAAHARHVDAPGGRPPQGRPGAPRSLQHRDHAGHLLPRLTRDAGGRRIARRRPHRRSR